jgi:hypothetical protein
MVILFRALIIDFGLLFQQPNVKIRFVREG